MGTLRKAKVPFSLALFVLLWSWFAFADELAEFDKGRNSYSRGAYEQAADRFAQMLDADNPDALKSSDLIEQARIYRVASLIALGRTSEADKEIETILRVNPSAYPDPVIFPGVVLDRFTDVRGKIRSELEAQAKEKARMERLRLEKEQAKQRRARERIKRLEQLATQEVRVVQNSRWLAALPFGVGQFQNEQQELGWLFLTTEFALASTTVVTSAIYQDLSSKGTQDNVDPEDLNDRIATMKTVNNLAFAALALTAVGGIIHSQLTYVPERREVRQRELPKELMVEPRVSALPGGAMVGVGGSF
ncbi:MAG: hypothetical protein CSA75_05660 [Sorangium cellulosum]|nr:MAG: hypothetical protein CSA75_05660 [Sorangium cellulosum]